MSISEVRSINAHSPVTDITGQLTGQSGVIKVKKKIYVIGKHSHPCKKDNMLPLRVQSSMGVIFAN